MWRAFARKWSGLRRGVYSRTTSNRSSLKAFKRLGGSVREREPRRYEITHVPAPVRNRDRQIGAGDPVLPRYERAVFEKPLIAPPGRPLAAFVCPGHPLLDAVLDLTLERHRDLLKRGTALVDERDPGKTPRLLFFLEHAIQDASVLPTGERRTISRRMLYVEMNAEGGARHLHYAPYLDYRPLAPDEPNVATILARPECAWITRGLEQQAQSHAIAHVVPEHKREVRERRMAWIEKTRAAVKDRLTKEIAYWDHRAEQLRLQEQAGRAGARLNSQEARRRADELQGRLEKRLGELDREAQISALPPVVLGAVVVTPMGLVAAMTGHVGTAPGMTMDTQASAAKARAVVMEVERGLGYEPADREQDAPGPLHTLALQARAGLRGDQCELRPCRAVGACGRTIMKTGTPSNAHEDRHLRCWPTGATPAMRSSSRAPRGRSLTASPSTSCAGRSGRNADGARRRDDRSRRHCARHDDGHPGERGQSTSRRDGSRTRPRLRAGRPRAGEAWLRRREPDSRYGKAALPGGKGPS